MRRGSRLVAAGVAAFLCFLVALLPARLLLRFLPPDVALTQVSGTVWRGGAGSVALRLQPDGSFHPVGSLRWQVRPWRLALLELDYAVELRPPDGQVDLDVVLGSGERVELANIRGSFPLRAIDGLFAPTGWQGLAELDVERIVSEGNYLRGASGTLVVRDLTAAGPGGINIGSFELTLGEGAVGGDVIAGRLRDLGNGPMRVRGTLELKADRSYLLSGEVAPGTEENAVITRTLSFLGPPDSLGRRPFTIEGTL
jgi:general secretion pathway protein N